MFLLSNSQPSGLSRISASILFFLILALPVHSASLTPNDLFRPIALTVPKPPEEPVCCLRPLPPLEPEPEDELLLSFEEWKAKRALASPSPPDAHPSPPVPGAGAKDADIPPSSPPAEMTTVASVEDPSSLYQDENQLSQLSPHFRVPLTDRFNFAATDCSARVHTAHKSARGASGILSSKRDRYMLSPCSEERQYVVVELCDDIRIDTVQLANFEFFSSVYKDVRISVAKTYEREMEGWTVLGTYRARNRRGVQSFHPPTSFRDFYRYIRIDFLSHYGSEYYCPVSLLRVYGLTHLDEWKWEMWAAESRAKTEQAQAQVAPAPVESAQVVIEKVANEIAMDVTENGEVSGVHKRSEYPETVAMQSPSISLVAQEGQPTSSAAETSRSPNIPSSTSTTSAAASDNTPTSAYPGTSEHISSTSVTIHIEMVTTVTSAQVSSTPASSMDASPTIPSTEHPSSDISTLDKAKATSTSTSSILASTPESTPASSSHSLSNPSTKTATPTMVPVVVVSSAPSASGPHSSPSNPGSSPPSGPSTTGGESIYRVIMNRLSALEANSTLYARFVDAHASATREALRRISEDVGRLDSSARVHAANLKRAVEDAERERKRLERVNTQLAGQLAALAADVRQEKQLGVAQLVLVLAVLVFMGLTRGNAPPATTTRRHTRTRSFGGDLFSRLRTKSLTGANAPPPTSTPFPARGASGDDTDTTDTKTPPRLSPPPIIRRMSDDTAFHASGSILSLPRPRTPTTKSVVFPRGSGAPSALAVQRVSSNTHVSTPPRSVRRWARTAHLHELRTRSKSKDNRARSHLESKGRENDSASPTPRRRRSSGTGNMNGKTNGAAGAGRMRAPLEPLRIEVPPQGLIVNGEPEVWVDTDVDGDGEDEVEVEGVRDP